MNQANILDIGISVAIIIILVTIGFMSVRLLLVRRRRRHHSEEPAVEAKAENVENAKKEP